MPEHLPLERRAADLAQPLHQRLRLVRRVAHHPVCDDCHVGPPQPCPVPRPVVPDPFSRPNCPVLTAVRGAACCALVVRYRARHRAAAATRSLATRPGQAAVAPPSFSIPGPQHRRPPPPRLAWHPSPGHAPTPKCTAAWRTSPRAPSTSPRPAAPPATLSGIYTNGRRVGPAWPSDTRSMIRFISGVSYRAGTPRPSPAASVVDVRLHSLGARPILAAHRFPEPQHRLRRRPASTASTTPRPPRTSPLARSRCPTLGY